MIKPTPRSELVQAVTDAWSIIDEAIPLDPEFSEASRQEFLSLRAAAMPVILREVLDVEIMDDEIKGRRAVSWRHACR